MIVLAVILPLSGVARTGLEQEEVGQRRIGPLHTRRGNRLAPLQGANEQHLIGHPPANPAQFADRLRGGRKLLRHRIQIQRGRQFLWHERFAPTDRRNERARCRLRSEEHTSELQSLMRISYAVFCLKKKTKSIHYTEE